MSDRSYLHVKWKIQYYEPEMRKEAVVINCNSPGRTEEGHRKCQLVYPVLSEIQNGTSYKIVV